MSAQTTLIPEQQLVEAAKAPELAYNEKNWDAFRASVTPDFMYDEVATQRKVQGVDQALAVWQGWATAFPDSKATFHSAFVSGNTVTLEVTWQGTHQGPLQTSQGPIAPTGRRISLRACMVVELAEQKAKEERHYFDLATLMQQLGLTG